MLTTTFGKNVVILVLTGFYLSGCAASDQVTDEVDPSHPACMDAFNDLPVTKSGQEAFDFDAAGSIILVGNDPVRLRRHFIRHAEAYRRYDAACFFPLRSLKPATAAFVKNTVGVLFVHVARTVYEPYCSAFRISRDRIVTAAHCLTTPIYFSLIGNPTEMLRVHLEEDAYFGTPNSDLDDYAILRIDEPAEPFDLTKAAFSRKTLPRQQINVIALSMPAFVLGEADVAHWIDFVRFTRLNAAQIWSFHDAGRDSSEPILASECLLHRAPTFPGMSGAPIIAVRRPAPGSDQPILLIVGIHLRNGAPASRCGDWADYNIGLRLPPQVLTRIE